MSLETLSIVQIIQARVSALRIRNNILYGATENNILKINVITNETSTRPLLFSPTDIVCIVPDEEGNFCYGGNAFGAHIACLCGDTSFYIVPGVSQQGSMVDCDGYFLHLSTPECGTSSSSTSQSLLTTVSQTTFITTSDLPITLAFST